jgi:hypothetical protein
MPTLSLTADDAIEIPGMGIVTGTVTYTNGTSDTLEEPGEEAGIEDVTLKDAFGTDLDPEDILEVGTRIAALEGAIWEILSVQDAADHAAYAAELEALAEVGDHKDHLYW